MGFSDYGNSSIFYYLLVVYNKIKMSASSIIKSARGAQTKRISRIKFPALPSLKQMVSQMMEENVKPNVVEEAKKEVSNKKIKYSPTRKRKPNQLSPIIESEAKANVKSNAKSNTDIKLPPLKGTRRNPSAVAIGGRHKKSCRKYRK